MVPLNMTYLHCLQHSLFKHLFNLYVQLEDPTHVCGNTGEEGVGYLQQRCPVEDPTHVCGNTGEEVVGYIQQRCPV